MLVIAMHNVSGRILGVQGVVNEGPWSDVRGCEFEFMRRVLRLKG